MQPKKTGAQLAAECLVTHGVKYIFGIPGAKVDALFDALLDTPIKIITCRHEQNATFLAAAYGRLTGTPGVVLVTSGPGVSNLVTGLLTATTEGDPVIAIGANVPREMRLKQSHQSSDNVKITEGATKMSVEIMASCNIPEVIENAFRTASCPRSGAVFISIPQDVLLEQTDASMKRVPPHVTLGAAPKSHIDQAAALIDKAKLPILLLGMEASRPENTAAIRSLLHKTPLATISTYQAAGALSKDLLGCFVGRVGLFKNQPGDKLLDNADLVLTVGFNPVEYDSEVWNAAKNKTIIHLDYQPASIHLTYVPHLELIGSIASNLKALQEKMLPKEGIANPALVKELQTELKTAMDKGAHLSGMPIHPLRFLHDLRSVCDADTTIISDIGTHYIWIARYFFSYEPHHLLFSNGQQTLGVALPWAMATTLVRPGKKVISISGDGGFLFSAMELETAVREKMDFVHCIFCDNAYNMVLEQQLIKYKRDCAVHFGHIDFVAFAKSFGAHGFCIQSAADLLPTLQKALSLKGPVIIQIPIDYSDNPPLFASARVSSLGH